MKKITFYLTMLLAVNLYSQSADKDISKNPTIDFEMLKKIKAKFLIGNTSKVKDEFMQILNAVPSSYGKIPYANADKVMIEDEFVKLFSPDNFKCDCDIRVTNKLKKIVSYKKTNDKNEVIGFIPEIIKNRIGQGEVVKISGKNLKFLANGFTYNYKKNNEQFIYSGCAIFSPTATNFNFADYIDADASNFAYNLDCSGYLSAALATNLGIPGAAIETSAKSALKSSNSLMIVGGIMYTPLSRAYKGIGEFNDTKKETLILRKTVLEQILITIPAYAQNDDTELSINNDYRILLTSNIGSSSFNGDVDTVAKANAGFGFGGFTIDGKGGGTFQRKSDFSDFNCYVLNVNEINQQEHLTLKDLKDKITELNTLISATSTATTSTLTTN